MLSILGVFLAEEQHINYAKPNIHFAIPPYKAELFSKMGGGCAGVMNANRVNCLTFTSKPGTVLTNFENAQAIAENWNLLQ